MAMALVLILNYEFWVLDLERIVGVIVLSAAAAAACAVMHCYAANSHSFPPFFEAPAKFVPRVSTIAATCKHRDARVSNWSRVSFVSLLSRHLSTRCKSSQPGTIGTYVHTVLQPSAILWVPVASVCRSFVVVLQFYLPSVIDFVSSFFQLEFRADVEVG